MGRNRTITAKEVAALGPGRHAIGNGLYLVRSASGAARWLFFYKRANRRREMGLGSYPTVGLAEARKRAAEARAMLTRGEDPIEAKRKTAAAGMTFGQAAEACIAAMEPGWRSPKQADIWRQSLRDHAAPLMDKPVAAIETEDVLGALTPIWPRIPETASRTRGRVEAVLDYAKTRGWREGENPARWKGHLAHLLPRPQKLAQGHFGAMPWQDVPAFMAFLAERQGVAPQALRFTILTAARSGEVRGATWGEIDMAAAEWNIPGGRMKTGEPHRVPLTKPALAILEDMRALAGSNPPETAFVFPGQKEGAPLSAMAMENVLRRASLKEAGVTVHGFRSAFRDWAAEATDFDNHVVEKALAHAIPSSVERAYRRSDLRDKRRRLMDAWAAYLQGEATAGNVVTLRR